MIKAALTLIGIGMVVVIGKLIADINLTTIRVKHESKK